MMRLTGRATEIMVASKAQARLTMAMEVKAARSRHPGLNFSTSSEFEVADGSTLFPIVSGSTTSCLVKSEPAGGSICYSVGAHSAGAGLESSLVQRAGKQISIFRRSQQGEKMKQG